MYKSISHSENQPEDAGRFLECLIKSGLVGLKDLCSVYAELGTAPNLEQLCSFLLDSKLLTRWQCNRLQEGKFKGYYMDHYCLLSRRRNEGTVNYYLALDLVSKKQVEMTIEMPKQGEPIRYKVDDLPD